MEKKTMKYAVMIKERYERYLTPVWITHSVETDANLAYWILSGLSAQGYAAQVVIYHSQEWERLVG
jgi:hypothetical protein